MPDAPALPAADQLIQVAHADRKERRDAGVGQPMVSNRVGLAAGGVAADLHELVADEMHGGLVPRHAVAQTRESVGDRAARQRTLVRRIGREARGYEIEVAAVDATCIAQQHVLDGGAISEAPRCLLRL